MIDWPMFGGITHLSCRTWCFTLAHAAGCSSGEVIVVTGLAGSDPQRDMLFDFRTQSGCKYTHDQAFVHSRQASPPIRMWMDEGVESGRHGEARGHDITGDSDGLKIGALVATHNTPGIDTPGRGIARELRAVAPSPRQPTLLRRLRRRERRTRRRRVSTSTTRCWSTASETSVRIYGGFCRHHP